MTRHLEVLTDSPDDGHVVGCLDVSSYLAAPRGQPWSSPPSNSDYNALVEALGAIDAQPVRLANTLFKVADLRRAWQRVRTGGAA